MSSLIYKELPFLDFLYTELKTLVISVINKRYKMMDINKSYFKIQGGGALKGEVCVSGAKNSALPLLFASLLADGEHKFKNIPFLKDVQLALKVLSSFGVSFKRSDGELCISTSKLTESNSCLESAGLFRASVLCLGPLLARFGKVKIPLPGGCDIGSRPIDIHLKGLQQMGAEVSIKEGFIHGFSPKGGLKSADIYLDFPSVGATENLVMAAVLAKGKSCLRNTANEPEIIDLINYLKSLGAQIKQTQPGEIQINGTSCLKTQPKPYTVIPDRIEAGTWLIAGACTKGEVLVKNCQAKHLQVLLEKLKSVGFIIESEGTEIFLRSGKKQKSVNIKTGVYPFFPTDLQSQFMVLMTQLKGLSSLEETIFENRFRYIKQLNLLGASIEVKGNSAFVKGPIHLKAHKMEATDLRAGAGLALAGLIADGVSELYGLHHIERGYENFFSKLKSLNGNIDLCTS